MCSGSLGSTATAPTNSGGSVILPALLTVEFWSKSGCQVLPPLLVFQAPPPAVASQMVFGSNGSTETPVTRPETGALRPMVGPLSTGPPCWNQVGAVVGAVPTPLPAMMSDLPVMVMLPAGCKVAPRCTTTLPEVAPRARLLAAVRMPPLTACEPGAKYVGAPPPAL